MNFEKIQQLTDSIHRTVDALNEQYQSGSSAPHAEQPLAGEPQSPQNPGPFPTPNERENYGGPYSGGSPRFTNPWWNYSPQPSNYSSPGGHNFPPMRSDYPTWRSHYPYTQMPNPTWWSMMPPMQNYTPYWWNNHPYRQTHNRLWWNNSLYPQMHHPNLWNSPYPYTGYNSWSGANNWWTMQTPEYGTYPRSDSGYPPYHSNPYPPTYGKPMTNNGDSGWNWYPPYSGYRNPSMMNSPYGWYGPNPNSPTPPMPESVKNPFVLAGPWNRPNSYDYGMNPNMMNYHPPMPNSWEAVDIPLAA